MSTHTHVITKNATRTGAATVPDPAPAPDLTIYAKVVDLKALADRVYALEHPVVIPPSPPTTRPFPAPVTTQSIPIPASIDATGATDVSAGINGWLAGVPDGSIITATASAIYRLPQGIMSAARKNLIFRSAGASLHLTGAGGDQLASAFILGHAYNGFWGPGGSDIAIEGFRIIGNAPKPGTFVEGTEAQAGFEIEAATRVEISGCTIEGVWGDALKTGDAAASIWFHDNICPTIGRNGTTIISGTDILSEKNTFGKIGYCAFDIEPNLATEATLRAIFRANVIASWGNAFFALDGSNAGAPIDTVTVDGNSVTVGSLLSLAGFVGSVPTKARPRSIAVTNNHGSAPDTSRFAHIDGLTYKGNSPGGVPTITDCTLVVQ